MEIITTPWKDTFLTLAANTGKNIKITSPFIKESICDDLLKTIKGKVKIELITSFKLVNICSGSLDLSGLEKIIDHNGKVFNFSKLHSKIYLFDEKDAIITSGNMTNSGMLNNFEYGIYLNDLETIKKINNDFEKLLNDERTGVIKQKNIDTVRSILSKIERPKRISLPKIEAYLSDDVNDILELPVESISGSLTGWKAEIFKCANSLPSDIFNLDDINRFIPHLKRKYPNNNHIQDKIRQQLQILRDLGLIEFLGNGSYKKLWE
jgi:HKD family nuclease